MVRTRALLDLVFSYCSQQLPANTNIPSLPSADGDSEEEGYPLQGKEERVDRVCDGLLVLLTQVFFYSLLLKECQADCDDDDECSGDLICFQRSDTEPVPGCVGNGADFDGKDFCIKTPVAPITSMIPLKKVGNDGEPEDVFPLDEVCRDKRWWRLRCLQLEEPSNEFALILVRGRL